MSVFTTYSLKNIFCLFSVYFICSTLTTMSNFIKISVFQLSHGIKNVEVSYNENICTREKVFFAAATFNGLLVVRKKIVVYVICTVRFFFGFTETIRPSNTYEK